MSFRNDLPFWQIPLTSFQAFDRGETITDTVPRDWNLLVNDSVEYEAGDAISGLAKVVKVETGEATAWDRSRVDDGEEVPGVVCHFEKES